MNIIRHDDLQPILRSNEWQQIAQAISDLINKQDDVTHDQATRAVLYALQVAGIADATCAGCRGQQDLVWPIAVQHSQQDYRATYICNRHGGWQIDCGHGINIVDVSGLT